MAHIGQGQVGTIAMDESSGGNLRYHIIIIYNIIIIDIIHLICGVMKEGLAVKRKHTFQN